MVLNYKDPDSIHLKPSTFMVLIILPFTDDGGVSLLLCLQCLNPPTLLTLWFSGYRC